jgi:uncharacterized protein involved in type VI secretion and phage assembly
MTDRLDEVVARGRGAGRRFYGKYRGVVVDNDDGTDRGRLLVRVPDVLADAEVWALPCVPYAGKGVGFFAVPPQDAHVWCEFEGGDPQHAIWVGCFWGDGELPGDAAQGVFILKTEKATFSVDDDADEILLENSSSTSVTLAADAVTASNGASHTVAGEGVSSDSGSGGLVEVTGPTVKINSGAMEVV